MSEAETQAKEIFASFVDNKEILDSLSKEFSQNYRIGDKTLKEWATQFRVRIPSDLELHMIPTLSAEVANHFQTALFYLSFFEAQLDVLESGSSKEFGSKYSALVAQYKKDNQKIPAAATLETLVNNEISSITSARLNAKVCRDFFKREVEGLTETRKALENSLWALRADVKVTKPLTVMNND